MHYFLISSFSGSFLNGLDRLSKVSVAQSAFGLNNKKPSTFLLKVFDAKDSKICRGERIRTSDLYVPNVAHYRAVLHPEFKKPDPKVRI